MRNPIEIFESIFTIAPRISTSFFLLADSALAVSILLQDRGHMGDVSLLFFNSLTMYAGIATAIDLTVVAMVSSRWEWKTVSSGTESVSRPARMAEIALFAVAISLVEIAKVFAK